MTDRFMYIPYDEKQIYLFSSADWDCELKSLNTSSLYPTNQNPLKVPKVFEPTLL